jgi:FkbM family methyltransferase
MAMLGSVTQALGGVKRKTHSLIGSYSSIIEHRFRCAIGNDIHPRPSAPCNKAALGSGDGRWVICPDRLDSNSVVYSFGVGTDISFDLALIRRFGCAIHAFDPTPLALQWLQTQTLPASFTVHPWGLAGHDGVAVFSLPEEHAVSFLMSTDGISKVRAECNVFRFPTILAALGHQRINLMKLDIEGAEYDVLDDLLAENASIDQLLVEFHHRWSGSPARTKQAIRRIEEHGLRLFNVSARGLEYSFVREF